MRNKGQTVIEYLLIITVVLVVGLTLFSKFAKADSMPEPKKEEQPCVKLCQPAPAKPKPAVKKQVVVKTVIQKEKPEQKQEQEQGQDQKQNVNVYINNGSDHHRYRERIIHVPKRARFRVGAHAGCGPVGVKQVQVSPTVTQYALRDSLVVGGSLSIRVLGPVWITGQMFTNGLTTGGVEVEF